jgi:hypothetical protein
MKVDSDARPESRARFASTLSKGLSFEFRAHDLRRDDKEKRAAVKNWLKC